MTLTLPSTLTPSKLGRFVSCPLAFRYSYIEHLPEPPSIYQLRGTLLHRALQLLFEERSSERTMVAASSALARATGELGEEIEGLELGATDLAAFHREAGVLLEHYFALEDPTGVQPVGLELDLRANFEGIELRGIIDRLDRLADGRFVVVDYKTGRSPRPEQSRSRLVGVQFYAFLCEQTLGIRPSEVRLMYLKDQVVVVESPTDQSMRGLTQRARAVWTAIERACTADDFRPNPSPLCNYCAFQDFCPAYAAASA
ncbi:MAG TPA: PD-(D/E)XK nuclease family protein [Acidimicrobiales bacterium]|nr:PD-(D/E)XK nuclease family protein [Acidimicrobiales bacterium]